MTTATELFEGAMEWLRENYSEYQFFKERDIEWTLQSRISKEIEKRDLAYRVFDNHTVSANPRKSADLVILEHDNSVGIGCGSSNMNLPMLERPTSEEIFGLRSSTHLPSFGREMEASQKTLFGFVEFVESGGVRVGYSVFIDEGSNFRHKKPFEGSEWVDWEDGVSVLWGKFRV